MERGESLAQVVALPRTLERGRRPPDRRPTSGSSRLSMSLWPWIVSGARVAISSAHAERVVEIAGTLRETRSERRASPSTTSAASNMAPRRTVAGEHREPLHGPVVDHQAELRRRDAEPSAASRRGDRTRSRAGIRHRARRRRPPRSSAWARRATGRARRAAPKRNRRPRARSGRRRHRSVRLHP